MYKAGTYRAFDSSTHIPKEGMNLADNGIRTEYTYERGIFGVVTKCISVRVQLANGDWVDFTPTMTKRDIRGFAADIGFMINHVPGFLNQNRKLTIRSRK